jgi:hypothetical protein
MKRRSGRWSGEWATPIGEWESRIVELVRPIYAPRRLKGASTPSIGEAIKDEELQTGKAMNRSREPSGQVSNDSSLSIRGA